jgi:hypothetical protein
MDTVANALSTLTLGAPVAFEALTFFPLVSPHARQPDYLTLDEALAGGHARVTEVSEGGSVPELRFVNGSDHRVLLLDGEELVGAKQNRVLNVTILVAPKQTVTIPVSCVEQGRWSYDSPEFGTAGRAQFARGRAEKAAQVSSSLREHGVRRSDQGQVWDAIQAKADLLQAHSATGSMSDIFERYTADLGSYERALPPVEGQVGAVFAVAGEVSGLDLFDAGATLGKLWTKLVGSYALDAIEAGARRPGDPPVPAGAAADGFLRAVASARADRFPALGLGEDLRLEGPGLAGGALAVDGRVVHLGAFRLNGQPGTRRPGMVRASARRAQRL